MIKQMRRLQQKLLVLHIYNATYIKPSFSGVRAKRYKQELLALAEVSAKTIMQNIAALDKEYDAGEIVHIWKESKHD